MAIQSKQSRAIEGSSFRHTSPLVRPLSASYSSQYTPLPRERAGLAMLRTLIAQDAIIPISTAMKPMCEWPILKQGPAVRRSFGQLAPRLHHDSNYLLNTDSDSSKYYTNYKELI